MQENEIEFTPEAVALAQLLFTDGSSLGNPGPGGWGAVLVLSDGRVMEIGRAHV